MIMAVVIVDVDTGVVDVVIVVVTGVGVAIPIAVIGTGAARVDGLALLVLALDDVAQALAALDFPDGPAQRLRVGDAGGREGARGQHGLVLAGEGDGGVVAAVILINLSKVVVVRLLGVVELADPEAGRLCAGAFEDVEGHVVDLVGRVDAEGGGGSRGRGYAAYSRSLDSGAVFRV